MNSSHGLISQLIGPKKAKINRALLRKRNKKGLREKKKGKRCMKKWINCWEDRRRSMRQRNQKSMCHQSRNPESELSQKLGRICLHLRSRRMKNRCRDI
jgi:hypothetical protein